MRSFELFAAHTTWGDYSEMVRAFKHVQMRLAHPSVAAQAWSYSSYPGFVYSSDDFYLLDSGLVVLETTINILNERLYDQCDPGSTVMAWVRNMVANRVARTGEEWTRVYGRHNSGTYNDQWMVVDYNRFEPHAPALRAGTLWVLEQIPGKVVARDLTAVLQRDSYWASYNRPYFEEVVEASMFRRLSESEEMLSYRRSPRGLMFQRDHAGVRELADVQRLMQKNEWQTDPLARGCPGNAIAGRYDLDAPGCAMKRVANGASDAKVTSAALARRRAALAIAGPTHQGQPPFRWDAPMFDMEYHEGQPVEWRFGWVEMSPSE